MIVIFIIIITDNYLIIVILLNFIEINVTGNDCESAIDILGGIVSIFLSLFGKEVVEVSIVAFFVVDLVVGYDLLVRYELIFE